MYKPCNAFDFLQYYFPKKLKLRKKLNFKTKQKYQKEFRENMH